jgi:hypothetical protein
MLRAPEHNPEKLQTLRTRTCSKRATSTDDSGGFTVTFAAQVRGNVSKRRNSKEAPQLTRAQPLTFLQHPAKKLREIRSAFLSRGQVGILDWISAMRSGLRAMRQLGVVMRCFESAPVGLALLVGGLLSAPTGALADEGGVSFWLPGLFGSLAAVPQQPGWALTVINYYDSVGASGGVAASREITIGRFNPTVNVNLNVNLSAKIDVGLINPSYVFATPVFGGQLTLGVLGFVGTNHTALDGTLTLAAGPLAIMRQGSISQTTTGFGDLYPEAIIRWNSGVNNWMTSLSATIVRAIWRISASVTAPSMAAEAIPILIRKPATNFLR